MAKSSAYFEKRIAQGAWNTYNSLEEKNRALLEFYIDASDAVKEELYELAEKYSKDGVLTLSEVHKQNRLTELNKKYEKIVKELGEQVQGFCEKNMQKGFMEVYRNVALGLDNIETDFSMPNKKLMEKLLNEPWRGDSFFGRLWKNQKRLAVGLNNILLIGLQQGKTVTEIAINLHNIVGNSFNNCHRLVRTETMHYLNHATLLRYKDSDMQYVRIWAAVDERTCETCGVNGYHNKVYPIEKAPILPFHPNCRCTYLPADEEEYLKQKGIQMNDVTEDMVGQQRQKENLIEKTNQYARTVEKYSVRKSKWSGMIVFDDEKCKKEHIAGRKLWSCDILLKTNCQDRTIIHELLHSCSGSYMNPLTVIPFGKMEEASVEMLAREICRDNGISFTPNKNKNVDVLYEINSLTHICEVDMDFAIALFTKDLKRRYNWLEGKVNKFIEKNELSRSDKSHLYELLEKLKGHK